MFPDRSHVTHEVKSMVLAYRLWALCHPKDWNLTYQEAADALGVSRQAVVAIARKKGWLNLFRTQRIDLDGITFPMRAYFAENQLTKD